MLRYARNDRKIRRDGIPSRVHPIALEYGHPIDKLPAIHPGSFLREELEALGTSARKTSEHIHVPHDAVTDIMNGERSISAQMAIRLGQAFGTTPLYWLNLQSICDLKQAQAEMPGKALRIQRYAVA